MVPELGNDGEVLLSSEAISGIWGDKGTVAGSRGHRRGRSRTSAWTLVVHGSLEGVRPTRRIGRRKNSVQEEPNKWQHICIAW